MACRAKHSPCRTFGVGDENIISAMCQQPPNSLAHHVIAQIAFQRNTEIHKTHLFSAVCKAAIASQSLDKENTARHRYSGIHNVIDILCQLVDSSVKTQRIPRTPDVVVNGGGQAEKTLSPLSRHAPTPARHEMNHPRPAQTHTENHLPAAFAQDARLPHHRAALAGVHFSRHCRPAYK